VRGRLGIAVVDHQYVSDRADVIDQRQTVRIKLGVAPALCACSRLPSATSPSGPYANLNEPPPRRDPGADQEAARAKADLSATRDAVQRQAFHYAIAGRGLRSPVPVVVPATGKNWRARLTPN
jgi:hypothetical protein